MTTRNVFRFVSVRPPIQEVLDQACRLIHEDAGERFVELIQERQQEHEESLQVARRAVAVDVIASPGYFAREDDWQELRPLRERFEFLVRALLLPPDDADSDVETVKQELAAALSTQVHDWVDSDAFTAAKDSVWHSYYANALAPEVRPHDRAEMLGWIRVLASLEQLRPALEDADARPDEAVRACIERLGRARVNVPQEFFAEAPPADPVPEDPEDPIEEDIVALRASLERLGAARLGLDRHYRHKVSMLRLSTPTDDEDPVPEVRRTPAAGADDAEQPVTASVTPRHARPPWLLTEEDADQLPELGTELDRLGVPLAGSLLPEAAGALDEAIAVDTAALAALEARVDVLGVGPTMVLARRTTRGFRRAPRGSAAGPDRTGQDTEGRGA